VKPVAITEQERSAFSAIPAAARVGLTLDEFLEQCGDGAFLELVRGEVVQLAPAGGQHSRTGGRVYRLLDEFVEENDLGIVFNSDAGFILEQSPYTVRSPDVAFISKDRMTEEQIPAGYIPGAPDLAVEILSPTDTLQATEAKARMYLRAGAKLVLIMTPGDQTIRAYRPEGEVAVLGPDDELDADHPALPGFRCPVWKLFGPRRKE
jgi:Uma2 family endonuclease